jgi:hypothetical protein
MLHPRQATGAVLFALPSLGLSRRVLVAGGGGGGGNDKVGGVGGGLVAGEGGSNSCATGTGGTIALVLVVRKPMATHLVLVEAEQQLIRAVAVVDIGVVGARLRHLNLIDLLQAATPVAVADRVTQAQKLHLFSMLKE